MSLESKFQIGKNGVTEGVIKSLNQDLKAHNQIRISVLKSADRDRIKVKEMAEEIMQKVNYNCNYKIIGFTIILKRQSHKTKNYREFYWIFKKKDSSKWNQRKSKLSKRIFREGSLFDNSRR